MKTNQKALSEQNTLYCLNDDQNFTESLNLPKADGTIWGEHSRSDLLPLGSLDEAVSYAESLVKPSQRPALGFLLGFKLLDEASAGELRFRLPEDELEDIESWLVKLARSFELEQEWQALSLPAKPALQKIVIAWQPYSFLTGAQKVGLFSHLSALLFAETMGKWSVRKSLVDLIGMLLADSQEMICVAGSDATSLLDIPFGGAKQADMIGHCHPLINRLGHCLFEHFECVAEDFLRLSQRKRWAKMICLPAFGRTRDDELLETFVLASRGQGRRSSTAEAEALWIEQCQKLLIESGWLIILLSEGFLSNASTKFAREWVQEHFMIDSVFSLPPAIFQPATGIRTSLVCLRKMTPPPERYQVFMAELDEEDLDNPTHVIESYRHTRQEERALV